MRRLLPVVLSASVFACSEASTVLPEPVRTDGGSAVDASVVDASALDAGVQEPEDPSNALFDRGVLHHVDVELDAADWNALRLQTRTLESTLARPDCLAGPFESPFTYFEGAVTVDGVRYDRVGIRKKGFLGSLSESRPSLKLKLDEYVPDLEHLGLSSLTLNNGQQDPSLIRTCLGFDAFRAAGRPSPRCSFAEVTVNGESLGPYANVEVVGKRFLRRAFGESEGHLYEGTLSDFRPGWLATFEQETDKNVPYDRSDLIAVSDALEAPDSTLLEALSPLVDLDAFFSHWATEVLVGHWDGYAGNTNNFFVYRPQGSGKVELIPWGVDAVYGVGAETPPYSVMAEGMLARRLYLNPEGRRRYLSTLEGLLSRTFDPRVVLERIDRDASLIRAAIPAEFRPGVDAATEALRDDVRGRRARLLAELDAGGAEWDHPLREPICFELGELEAELDTTFGTHPAQDPFQTGTGSLTATVAGVVTRGVVGGSSSGFGVSRDDAGQVVLILAVTTRDGSIPVLYLVIDPDLFSPGVIPIDGTAVRGALLRIPRPGAELEVDSYIWAGAIEIVEGATVLGAPAHVRVRATLIRPQ
ncbi:MAG: CotH kinase family protein [Deltaproteobacteria bacterium]|nr:CotH kinase family protein [Deltaproteobacteria bacterium]